MAKIEVSRKWSISAREWINGLYLAIGGAIFPILNNVAYALINSEAIEINWITVKNVSIGAAALYILKSLGSPSRVIAIKESGETTAQLEKSVKKCL